MTQIPRASLGTDFDACISLFDIILGTYMTKIDPNVSSHASRWHSVRFDDLAISKPPTPPSTRCVLVWVYWVLCCPPTLPLPSPIGIISSRLSSAETQARDFGPKPVRVGWMPCAHVPSMRPRVYIHAPAGCRLVTKSKSRNDFLFQILCRTPRRHRRY